jgi:U3 small nucleolar RNA-associated protein 14
MTPRKQKSKKGGGAPAEEERPQPKLVEHITDSDDEEIDEEEAFNSEDERKFGAFFGKQGGGKDGGGDDDDEDDEDVTSGSDDSEGDDGDDGDEEEDDGGQYMLDLLNKLDSGNSHKHSDGTDKLSEAQMASLPESEFSSSITKKGLTLDNLMEGLQDTQGFTKLQKTFAKQGQATPAPLAKVVADRTQRKIAYKDQSRQISAWTKAVQDNRQAETLDFKPKERLEVTRDSLVDKFEPTTDFEKEVHQALEDAGQQDEEAILKAEEAALQDDLGANKLTMEEYKKRRGQLAQMRALLFYHEQKRHQMKKIKSKKYRRIRKKQRERMKEGELDAAIEDDADLANELKQKEEVSRIQERMTLAHKNTSKWAKRILKRGKNVDVDTRRALSAQLKRGDDLRKKMMGDTQDSDHDSGDEDLVESARKVLADTSEDVDPTNGKAGLFKLSFMQKGIQKQRERAHEEARKLLSELESNERDDYDDAMGNDVEAESPKEKEKIASAKEMNEVLKKGELVASSLEFGNSNSIATSGNIEIELPVNDEEDRDAAEESSDTSKQAGALPSEHVSTLTISGVSSPKGASNEKQAGNSNKKRKKASSAPTQAANDEAEANPWMVPAEASATPSESAKKAKRKSGVSKSGIVDVDGAVDILDAGESSDKGKSDITKTTPARNTDAGEKKITMLSQEELVRRAFAGPSDKEAEEEFQLEKERMASHDDPTRKSKKEDSKDVAGWGSWTGKGAMAAPPRWSKLPKKLQAPAKKEPEIRKRKDDRKPNVILNEKRIKKTANSFMLGDIPYPYSSRAEYEQAMIGGVGKEWNVTSAYKNMTRPEILTRSGKMIQPISKKAKRARPAAKF